MLDGGFTLSAETGAGEAGGREERHGASVNVTLGRPPLRRPGCSEAAAVVGGWEIKPDRPPITTPCASSPHHAAVHAPPKTAILDLMHSPPLL